MITVFGNTSGPEFIFVFTVTACRNAGPDFNAVVKSNSRILSLSPVRYHTPTLAALLCLSLAFTHSRPKTLRRIIITYESRAFFGPPGSIKLIPRYYTRPYICRRIKI